jgi:hypothetical protein
MKLIGVISAAVLSLSLGVAVPAFAQEQHEEQKDQQEQKDKAVKPEEKRAQPEEKKAQEAKPTKQEEKIPQQHEQQAKAGQQAQHGRIPDDRYKANFGREHTFRVSQGDYGNRRFQYGGYWFGFVGEWPSNWLYTQEVFVVDIDGVYYLCNPMYPGVNVALSITF